MVCAPRHSAARYCFIHMCASINAFLIITCYCCGCSFFFSPWTLCASSGFWELKWPNWGCLVVFFSCFLLFTFCFLYLFFSLHTHINIYIYIYICIYLFIYVGWLACVPSNESIVYSMRFYYSCMKGRKTIFDVSACLSACSRRCLLFRFTWTGDGCLPRLVLLLLLPSSRCLLLVDPCLV